MFKLEKRHLRDGLSAEDFSQRVGYPVISARLSDFPYWEQLAGPENALTGAQRRVRAVALRKLLDATGLPDMGKDVCNDIAEVSSARIYKWRETLSPDYVAALLAKKQNLLLPPEQRPTQKTKRVPEILSAGLGEYFPFSGVRSPLCALLLRPPRESFSTTAQKHTALPQDRIIALPDDGLLSLFVDLHEMTHALQATFVSSSIVPTYYNELSADLNASATMRRQAVGEDTLRLARHCRYLNLLSQPPQYWIAPALDAAEAGETPPNFWQVHAATLEIRTRIVCHIKGTDCSQFDSSVMQRAVANAFRYSAAEVTSNRNPVSQDGGENLFVRCSKALSTRFEETALRWTVKNADTYYARAVPKIWRRSPELILSTLALLHKRGDFQEKLARSMATKILAAAEYVGGKDLTNHPHAPKRLQERLPTVCANN